MKPIDPRSPWHWIAFAFVLWWCIGGLILFMRAYLLPLFAKGDHSRFLSFWVAVAANAWIANAVIVFCLHQSATSLSTIGLEWPSRCAVLSLAIINALLVIAIVVKPEHNGNGNFPGMPPGATARAMMPWTRGDRLFMVVVMSTTAAICEEIAYRGFTLAFLRPMMGLWPAVVVQALLFTYEHGGPNQGLGGILFRFPGGMLFAMLALWRGNLRAAMAIHFVSDAVFFALG
jgi:membrane protease YdiL (CAAX protease family)